MKIYVALSAVLITGIGFAQQKDSLQNKRNSRFVIKMTHGLSDQMSFDFTGAQWEKMTPGFQIPDSLKPNEFGQIYDDFRSFSGSTYYMLSFSFINGSKKQAGRKFLATTSIHLGLGPDLYARKNWYHEKIQVIDTLTSSQTGNQYYVSENRNQTISKTYNSQTIVFGVGEHIATNPERRFQFETGVDILCMMSLASNVHASYYDGYSVNGLPQETNGGYPVYPYPQTNQTSSESFGGKLTTGVIMRVPLEISFKLSKKSPVASRMRLGAELNPGMATVFTPGLITSNFNVSGGMNFRFAF